MNSQKGFSIVILVAIVSVLVIGGGIAAFLYITSNTNPNLGSNAYTPSQVGITIPKPDTSIGFKNPQEQATPTATAPPTQPPAPTPSGSAIPVGQVNTTSSLSADAKTFTIRFESSSNFQGITTLSYNLTYTTSAGPKGLQGTFAIRGSTISTDTSGKQYIQRDITLGTCSSGSCVYDSNPRGFRVSVTTR